MTRESKIKLGILISGGGRTLLNLHEQIQNGELNAEIAVVISSLSNVKGLARAKDAGYPVEVIRKKDFPDTEAFSTRLVETLEQYGVDLVCQAGWTCFWRIPRRWIGRVMNIHPALLPKYGGQGYFGHHVHEAVIAAGDQESGCTVHFANNEYDAGPVILQRKVAVHADDDADALADRVFDQECIAYPEAIRLFAENRIELIDDTVYIREQSKD
jgi:formyltetrahydrofolate-dependent phosphoribosylglycinamide formyltransferase